jgi:hypothetical protein
MTIPFAEADDAQGPKESVYGLSELSRTFMGDAALWPAFRLSILPGTADYEYPSLRVSEINPQSLPGGLIKVGVSYVGAEGDGSGKAPGRQFSNPLKTVTGEATQKRTYEFLQAGVGSTMVDWYWQSHTDEITGELTQSFNGPAVTYLYCRPTMVREHLYSALAAVDLSGLNAAPRDRIFSATGAWPVLLGTPLESTGDVGYRPPPGPYQRNIVYQDPVVTGTPLNGAGIIKAADLSCRQRGTWFEVEETWELSYD